MEQSERIKLIMEHMHAETQSAFAELCDISPASVSHLLRGRNQLSFTLAQQICSKCKINLTWLLTGTGDMHAHESHMSSDYQPSLFDENSTFSHSETSEAKNRQDFGDNKPKNSTQIPAIQDVRIVEKVHRKITEIRIFFDDNTFQIFKPETMGK